MHFYIRSSRISTHGVSHLRSHSLKYFSWLYTFINSCFTSDTVYLYWPNVYNLLEWLPLLFLYSNKLPFLYIDTSDSDFHISWYVCVEWDQRLSPYRNVKTFVKYMYDPKLVMYFYNIYYSNSKKWQLFYSTPPTVLLKTPGLNTNHLTLYCPIVNQQRHNNT